MSRRAAVAWILLLVLAASVTPVSAAEVTGNATWYGTGPGAGHAAAGPGLRFGDWRGRRVTVSHGGRSVVVVLDDWCACRSGNRIIDLSDEDFSRLASLSEGVIRVTVTTGGNAPAAPVKPNPVPTGPPTDIEATP